LTGRTFTTWVGHVIERVPRPVPRENGKYLLYLSLEETLLVTDSCGSRPPDDYQVEPRFQLKLEYAAGSIVSCNDEEVKNFAKKFAVSKSL